MVYRKVDEVLATFIHSYKEYQCLWKVKSKDYCSRQKKEEAYKRLQLILKENNPDATIDDVKRKINSLRSCFRKEYKKVVRSKASASATDDIYAPNLWYFNILLFLKDQEVSRESEESEATFIQEDNEAEVIKVENLNEDNNTWDYTAIPSTSTTRTSTPTPVPIKMPQIERIQSEDVLKIIGENSVHYEDEFEIVGKNVAAKLRKLDPMMKIFAEKLINDVLFEAQLGSLDRTSFINCDQRK